MSSPLRAALSTLLLLVTLGGDARAGIGVGCVTEGDVTVCGTGKDAVRLFPDMTSPSGHYAIGWRSTAGLPAPEREPEGDVSNVLVRLSDGKVMTDLSGDAWVSGGMRGSRKDLKPIWSKDGRFLVAIFDERFGTSAIDVVAFDEGDNYIGSGEVKFVTARAAEADAVKRGGRYKIHGDIAFYALATENHVLSDKGGRLRFDAKLWAPKDGPYFHYKVDMRLAVARMTVRPDRISVKFQKFEPAETSR